MSRILSLGLAIFYAFIDSGQNDESTFPVLFVWYPEPIGDFTTNSFGRMPNKPTPAYAITAAGWFFLLLPLIIAGLNAMGIIGNTTPR